MTDQIVRLGPEYFPRPTSGIPVAGGSIYIGDPDTDPEIVGNQITVNALQENGSTVPISQPILTSGGGVPLYNGSPVTLLVSESYSLKVLDAFDVQVYYVPSIDVPIPAVAEPVVEYIKDMIGLINTSSPIDDQTHILLSFFDGLNEGSGTFHWDSTIDKATANGGTIIDPDNIGGFDGTQSTVAAYLTAQGSGVGFGCWVRNDESVLNVGGFGATGDGVDDDTVAIQSYSAVSLNIMLGENKTYLMTDVLDMLDNQTLELNGSVLNFDVTGETRCVVLNDTCTVRNGIVNCISNEVVGGDFMTPVQVGTSRDAIHRGNCVIENLIISTAKVNGNGIAAFGDVSGLIIRNIEFPQSETLGRAIMLHWGSLGVLPVAQTYHVHDVIIENIVSFGMDISTVSDASFIMLSAVYNVAVRNVKCFDIEHGDLVRIFAGDYGYQYAQTASEIAMGGTGITVENAFGKAGVGATVGMANPSGDITKVWPSSIKLSGFGVSGYGSTNTLSHGAELSPSEDTVVSDSLFSGFYSGAFLGGVSTDNKFVRVTFKDSYVKGFDSRFDATDITIRDCAFEGNNVAAGSGYDIFLEDCDNVLLDNNTFDSVLATSNVRLGTGADAPSRVKIVRNISRNVSATGPCFSLGGSGDDKICSLFSGNEVINVPTNGIVSGQLHVPYSRLSARAGIVENVEAYSASIPVSGAWNVGDRVYDSVPSAAGTIGWVCTVAGTPGTWKTFGAIAA